MVTSFSDQLAAAVKNRRTPALVGLDPRWEQLPTVMTQGGDSPDARAEAYRQFCEGIVDVVAPLVPAVKPQAAFFEELGPPGMTALSQVIHYARGKGLLVILDAKRNDIGSTARAYARGMLGSTSAWGADALTVSPYLGDDSLAPFVERAVQQDAGIFVLVKTSNPGSGMFQDRMTDGAEMYQHVAALVQQLSSQSLADCGYGAVGAVVGATYPEQLAALRAEMPNAWLLVPGFGSQGGSAADVATAFDERGLGAVINNSRGIIFAHRRPEYQQREGDTDWQDAVAAAMGDMIEQLRSATPAAKLHC